MPMTNEAARTVAALVNRPVAEIVALGDQRMTFGNVITGFHIEVGRLFQNNLPLTLQETNPAHRSPPVDLLINPDGWLSVRTGSFNSQGFKTLADVTDGLEKKAGNAIRTPLRCLKAALAVCKQAKAALEQLAPSVAA